MGSGGVASAEFAVRHIFCQDTYSRRRGPYAVSKAIGKCWRWIICWQTGYQQPKSARHPHSARIDSFSPSAVAACPHHRSAAFSHWKSGYHWCWDPRNLCMVRFRAELGAKSWRQATSMATEGPPAYITPFTPLLGPLPSGFCSSCPSQPPACGGRGPTKSFPWLIAPPCTLHTFCMYVVTYAHHHLHIQILIYLYTFF